MKIVKVVAGAEVLLAVVTGLYLLVSFAVGGEDLPLWFIVVAAGAYWLGAWELVRHARELVRRQKELEE